MSNSVARFTLLALAWTIFAVLVVGSFSSAVSAANAPPPDQKARPTSSVVFYGHVFGSGLDTPMPSNTQVPTGEDSLGTGRFDYCTSAISIDDNTNVEPGVDCDHSNGNKLVLYSTPGFVQIANVNDFNAKGGYQALHNEHGSTKDIVLDTSQHIKATVFTSVDFHSWLVGGSETYCPTGDPPRDLACPYPDWGWDPGVLPDSEVKASMYYAILGDYGAAAGEKPNIAAALASGKSTLVASGAVGPMQVENGIPGASNVLKWNIDLGSPKVSVIPKEANFFIVYQFEQNNVAGEYGIPPTARVWSGEYFAPTYTLPVKNAFDVEKVIPTFIHDKLVILGSINTPWGSYDVDPAATKLAVSTASGQDVTPQHIDVLADYSVAHGAHYKPVNVSFVWDYAADKLAPGTYTATISAGNHEGTATAACTGTFTIDASGAPGSVVPGFCGEQTSQQFLNQTGSMKMSGPAGNDADGSGAKVPTLPGVSGLVATAGLPFLMFATRRWSK
ncbi:MAG: hypothetical protein ACYDCK_00490 [Thermoplasmatota archaeon]